MNGYELSRSWFDFCFDNPEKIKPGHSAVYFFAIEHCNRLGWKDKFGFPSQMVMEAIGVKNWRTYSKLLKDLVDFGFIEMIETSKNQYSSNIIAIVKNTKASTKALDKALQKHDTKQRRGTVSIDKQETIEQETIEHAGGNKNNCEGTARPGAYKKFYDLYPKPFDYQCSYTKSAFNQAVTLADGEDVVLSACEIYADYVKSSSKEVAHLPKAQSWLSSGQWKVDWHGELKKTNNQRPVNVQVDQQPKWR